MNVYPTPEHVAPLSEGVSDFFDTSIEQVIARVIGEFDQNFVDSQEQLLPGMNSSEEELSEDDFDEGEYADDEVRSLEELIWPPEMLLNTCSASRPGRRRQYRRVELGRCTPGDAVGGQLDSDHVEGCPDQAAATSDAANPLQPASRSEKIPPASPGQ